MSTIANTTVISNFACIGQLELLHRLYGKLYISTEQELRLFAELPLRLHPGEAASLPIAYHRGWLLLTDDLDARAATTQLGVRLSGSLGCLVLAVERKLCSLEQGNSWLEQMIQQGYRSPVSDLTSLL
jgi:predicted nucleic acid-binding protein